MDDVLTHELIHAYDVCRAKFDRKNLEHLACSSVRNPVIRFYELEIAICY